MMARLCSKALHGHMERRDPPQASQQRNVKKMKNNYRRDVGADDRNEKELGFPGCYTQG